jgi:DNA repair exonuclease SbcCD nuclease subunit
MLKQSGVPIDIVVIPGNHDFERSYYMGSYLSAWFKDDASVCVNNHASPRKYYIYGNTMLGLTHGSEEKEASLPMLMATDVESKPHWTSTKFHEWHLGHIHRKRTVKYEINKSRELNEDLGVTIRYLSSLTGTEEWHHKKGFVGSTKAADAFVWNKEFGLVAHLNTNLILD